MDGMEKRHPRERFTRQLYKMCRALDGSATHEFEIDSYGETLHGRMEALQLWVVGSYARGAQTCADLDVVVSFNRSGAAPTPRVMQRRFFGALPGLRVYEGTPDKNRSGVPFPDAVLVWTNEGGDWKSRVDSIPVDPSAGRPPRDTDIIPLRAEQMSLTPNDLAAVVEQHQSGHLEWEFVPFDEPMHQPIPERDKASAEHRLQRISQDFGKKTLDLLPAVWRVLKDRVVQMDWRMADTTALH